MSCGGCNKKGSNLLSLLSKITKDKQKFEALQKIAEEGIIESVQELCAYKAYCTLAACREEKAGTPILLPPGYWEMLEDALKRIERIERLQHITISIPGGIQTICLGASYSWRVVAGEGDYSPSSSLVTSGSQIAAGDFLPISSTLAYLVLSSSIENYVFPYETLRIGSFTVALTGQTNEIHNDMHVKVPACTPIVAYFKGPPSAVSAGQSHSASVSAAAVMEMDNYTRKIQNPAFIGL